MAHHGFGVVLLLVLLSASFQVAAPDVDWSRLVTIVVGAATLLLSLWAARARRRLAWAGVLGALCLAVLSLGMALVLGDVPRSVAALVNGLLVALAPALIAGALVREMRVEKQVTFRTLSGVLAIYLLLGMLFSFLHGAAAQLEAGRYFTTLASPGRSELLYFSYITISTAGFGDLAPATDPGRMLAVAEALTGQLFLVTVVALVVANLRPRQRGPLGDRG